MLRTMKSEYDRLLLAQEVARLKALGYSFEGPSEETRLGVDAWVLQVGIVEDNGARKPRWLQKLEQKRNAIDMFRASMEIRENRRKP